MRIDPQPFASYNWSIDRAPRVVVQILFDVSSPSFTSHADISGVPGTLIEGVVGKVSSISQEVRPEEGRSTIGSMTVELVEKADWPITEELREQLLTYNQGPRDKIIRVYIGYTAAFGEFVLAATMLVDGIQYEDGRYTISARDRTRELRQDICEPKVTRLSATLAEDATTITVTDTSDFATVAHGPSYSDAPSATVGYLRIKKTGEVVRYTGKTSTTFTGVTRGVFNTQPQAVPWDGSDSRDNWPEVEEFIYLELPGPLMAIALMTGITDIDASPLATSLPAHWHMGMDWTTDFDQDTWRNIGKDLFDPANHDLGFPIRFLGLNGEDGKSLLERDVFQLLGVYAAVTTAGTLTLRRINRIIADNGATWILNEGNVINHGPLVFDHRTVRNSFKVEYNDDGEGNLTRSVAIIDADSISKHGVGEQQVLKFRGLHTARHTERAIKDRLAVLRDRYAEPPLRLRLEVAGYNNGIEIGDVVRVTLTGLQDFSANVVNLDRAFEVQRTQIDWLTGKVNLDLFASARLVQSQPGNDDGEPAIPDDWYTSTGTNISTLTGYVAAVGSTPARLSANVTLTGTGDLRDAGSIWYHAGDLDIDAGVTVTLQNQAQLRVRGFLQVDGDIDGAENGPAGAVDDDPDPGASTAWTRPGTPGAIGPTRSGDGLWPYTYDLQTFDNIANVPGDLTEARNKATSAGPLALIVDPSKAAASKLTGLPDVLHGTSGGSGGQAVRSTFAPSVPPTGLGTVYGNGGNGGAAGAGLLLVCRGLGFGVSGKIDLSGADGTPGDKVTSVNFDVLDTRNRTKTDYRIQAGAGAGGYPGVLHVILDGDAVPYPDINASTFRAYRGETPLEGYSAVDIAAAGAVPGNNDRLPTPRWSPDIPPRGQDVSPQPYLTGRNENWQGPAANIWGAAHFVQRAPAMEAPQEAPITPPSNLIAASHLGRIGLSWSWPVATEVDVVEVWSSRTNDRSFAELVATVRAGSVYIDLPAGGERYLWTRSRSHNGAASAWVPSSSTGGLHAVAFAVNPGSRDQDMSNEDDWDLSAYGSYLTYLPTGGPFGTGAWEVARPGDSGRVALWPKRFRLSDHAVDTVIPGHDEFIMEVVWRWTGSFTDPSTVLILGLCEWYSADEADSYDMVDLAADELTDAFFPRVVDSSVSPARGLSQYGADAWHSARVPFQVPTVVAAGNAGFGSYDKPVLLRFGLNFSGLAGTTGKIQVSRILIRPV